MKNILSVCLVLAAATAATAAPIVSVNPVAESSPGGLDLFTFNLDPNGEDSYTAVEVTITPTIGEFANVSAAAQLFAVPSDSSGAIGIGTVTQGYTFLGYGPETVKSDGFGFTFTSFGNPTSGFSGDLAQVTGAAGLSGEYVFRFADATGNVVDAFTARGTFGIPEPATAGLASLAIAGVLGFRRRR